MDASVSEFIREQVTSKKPRVWELIEEVSKKFEKDLKPSDVSFIQRIYRSIVVENWIDECINILSNKIRFGEISHNKTIKLLRDFQSIDAFEKTPCDLQGDFYQMILNERKNFGTNDFDAFRISLLNFLSYQISTFETRTINECEFFKKLFEVFKNSYQQFYDLASTLELQDFVDDNITVYVLSQNVLKNYFEIGKYDELQQIAIKIECGYSEIKSSMQEGIREFFEKIQVEQFLSGGKKILKLQKKLMHSKDLDVDIHDDVQEIHLICDILHVDSDLSNKYRGKNVLVMANRIRVHQNSTWNLSGHDGTFLESTDAGQQPNGDGFNGLSGYPGESGGNCEVYAPEIDNSEKWTIQSNGGTGINGQNGGNGIEGANGHDANKNDFKLMGQVITNSNFLQLLNLFGISTEIGSRRVNFFENGLEKEMIFNRDEQNAELMIIVYGSSAKQGGVGGFPGFGGRGGFAGKIEIHSKENNIIKIAKDGKDGQDGIFGMNGKNGRDGRDAYMKFKSNSSNPLFGGFNQFTKMKFELSKKDADDSIFYSSQHIYFKIITSIINDENRSYRNTLQLYKSRILNDQKMVFDSLISVFRNSNEKLGLLIKNLKIKEFIDREIDFDSFASAIVGNNFDIKNYDILKYFAQFFIIRRISPEIEYKIRKFIKEFVFDSELRTPSNKVCELRKMLVTSNDIEEIDKPFEKLQIICDTFHINSSLSGNFFGKSIEVLADTIIIHKEVEWNISGHDNFLQMKDKRKNDFCTANGGICIFESKIIRNTSLLTVKSNGGNASNAVNGIDVQEEDLLNTKITAFPHGKIIKFTDGHLEKQLVKRSNSEYILLAKGTSGIKGYLCEGSKGGLPGKINIKCQNNTINVNFIGKNGNDDISKEGRDVFLYVKDGEKHIYGLNERNKYDILTSCENHENSIEIASTFYYPKLARKLRDKIEPNDVTLYDHIIWVLRNSGDQFEILLHEFGIYDYVNYDLTLYEVAQNIVKINVTNCIVIANNSDLFQCAKNLKSSNNKNEVEIRKRFADLVAPNDVKKSSKTMTLKKKILFSSKLNKLVIDSNIEEIRIICDTLNIDSELSSEFRGKNLAIFTNYVYILKNVSWNLSGTEVVGELTSEAGQNDDGSGKDGIDGKAGNSGGNFSLKCKSIENSARLTIISNGSDGLNGQNGGNGKNGENGQNAKWESFQRNGVEWKMWFSGAKRDEACDAFHISENGESEVTTDDGLKARCFAYPVGLIVPTYGSILVHGSDGKPGKSGGLYGYGGEGGFCGKIAIKIANPQCNNFINTIQNAGNNGKLGETGYNGAKGRDGRDLYKYDHFLGSGRKKFGENLDVKYKVEWKSDGGDYGVYNSARQLYAHIVVDRRIQHRIERFRSNSKLTRNLANHAKAKERPEINMIGIQTEHSKYLSELTLEVPVRETFDDTNRNDLNTKMTGDSYEHHKYVQSKLVEISNSLQNDEEFKLNENLKQSEASRKSDILVGLVIDKYEDYKRSLLVENFEIAENNYDLNFQIKKNVEIQVQNKIKVMSTYEGEKSKKRTFKTDSTTKIFINNIINVLEDGCGAEKLLRMVINSSFEFDDYKNLLNKLKTFKIDESERTFKDNCNDLNNGFFNFIIDSGCDPSVEQYYQLLSTNNPEWKKCVEDPKVLEKFFENLPFFLINIFKNSIKDSKLDISDIFKICNEKILHLYYRNIFLQVVQHKWITVKNRTDITDKIPYLVDTNDFKFHLSSLSMQFNDNGEDEKAKILDYFLENLLNFNTSFPEAVFNLLNDKKYELSDISEILLEYDSKVDKIIAIDEDSENENKLINFDFTTDSCTVEKPARSATQYMTKKKEFNKLMADFFSNEKINEFIINQILNFGVKSMVYRRILAHKYGIKMTIFAKSFDGDLKIVEQHNYKDDLMFDYADTKFLLNLENAAIYPEELFLQMKYDKYSNLKLDQHKFAVHDAMLLLDSQLKIIVDVLNNKSTGEDSTIILEFLQPILNKFDIKNDTFLKIFTNDYWINNEALIDLLISHFPKKMIKYNENDSETIVLNENNIEQINIPANCTILDDEDFRNVIKLNCQSIIELEGLPILRAIAIRFHNSKIMQSLQSFPWILKAILDVMSEKHSMKYLLTFLILSHESDEWSLELAIMKLQSIYGAISDENKMKWRSSINKIKFKDILDLFLKKLLERDDADEVLDLADMNIILSKLKYFDKDNYEILKNSDLSTWKKMTTENYWKELLENLSQSGNEDLHVIFGDLYNKYGDNVNQLVNILKEKSQDEIRNENLLKIIENFNSGNWILSEEELGKLWTMKLNDWVKEMEKSHYTERNALKIVELVQSDPETSLNIVNNIPVIGKEVSNILKVTCSKTGKKITEFSEQDLKEWINSFNDPPVIETLAVIRRAFQLVPEDKITLRDTQLMSILTMWYSKKGVLMQVSTGEGKTFIGVSYAILKVLYDHKIDIITSSNVLAIRDAEENHDFFSFFNISVDHNCHEDINNRKKAYECKVVYGVLSNFQRDYLLTEFYNENFMPGHHFQNVLVDEVDSMLLDKGNNILYLSSDLPDMDELESVFVFIWQYVNQRTDNALDEQQRLDRNVIRSVVLDQAYGILDEDDVKQINPEVNASNVIQILKISGVIHDDNTICTEDYSSIDSILEGFDKDFIEKVKFFIKSKLESQKQVKIPKYLKKFVKLHLNEWIENAIRALILNDEQEYVVDKQITSETLSDPSIIILDLDTGTDMANSQWDGGLHQFLQLKHGCKLSMMSLKSVFISNVSFFKKYENVYGMTGTLGSLDERIKTTEMHHIDYVTIPRYITRRFIEFQPVLVTDSSLWVRKIHDEVVDMFNKNRSVLIICEAIVDTKIIKKELLKNSSIFTSKNVHVYQRDYSEFDIGKLDPKQVIIATNLAGRGTDIKLSEDLNETGGIHVILTYLPQNARIENQAMGRAARAGDRGSGRLIIYNESNVSLSKLRELRNQNELGRLNDVILYYKNFIIIEEQFFDKFHTAFRDLKSYGNQNINHEIVKKIVMGSILLENIELTKPYCLKVLSNTFFDNYEGLNDAIGTDAIKIYLDNFKLQWSFWLDENSKYLDNWKESSEKVLVQKNFEKFLSEAPKLHPVKRVELSKYYIKNDDLDKAKKILDYDFQEDSIAFQYYRLCEILKRNQKSNDHSRRSLLPSEKRELFKCLKMLNQRNHDRSVRCEMIKSLKQNHQGSLVSIHAFENQQKVLNEIDEILIDSIQNIIGYDITPQTLKTFEMKCEVMAQDLYDEITKNDCLLLPRISDVYTADDIRIVASNNNINVESLTKLLSNMRNTTYNSMKNFDIDLKKALMHPSREDFWNGLVEIGILTNEIEYAIIDMNILSNIDPSIHNEIPKMFKNENLTAASNSEIFFSSISTINDNDNYFKIPMKTFKPIISSKGSEGIRLNFLMDNNVIQINKKANFSIERFNEVRDRKIFVDFDEIKTSDFEEVCKNPVEIINKLTKTYGGNQKVLSPRSYCSYSLNYENIDLLNGNSNIDIFGTDFIYASSIKNLIQRKFAYRIAIEILAESIIENCMKDESSMNLVIHLHISPHLNVMNDLIANSIMEMAKVDQFDNDEFKNIKNQMEGKNFTILKLGEADGKFTKKLTSDLLKNNQKILINEFEKIEKNLKKLQSGLNNDLIEKPDLILTPIDEFLSTPDHRELSDFMKLKGFDTVIKIGLKGFTRTYYLRFTMIILIASAQIIIGTLIIVLSKGFMYKIGEMMIQEGIGDAIFVLGTLTTGHFSWDDYKSHKKVSVVTTLAFGAVQGMLSQWKYTERFFPGGKKLNSFMYENAKKNESLLKLVWNGEGKIGEGTRKMAWKIFKEQLLSSVGKVLKQSSIGIGSDKIIQTYVNETTDGISKRIIEFIHTKFPKHEISNTIDKLLNYYNFDHLKQVISDALDKISVDHQYYTDLAEKISNKVDELIQSGANISKFLTVPSTIITKLLQLTSVTTFAIKILDWINKSLMDVLNKKSDTDKNESKLKDEEIKKFKETVLEQIKADASEKLKNSINSTIVKPALTYTANAAVDKVTNEISKLREKYKEKEYKKITEDIIEKSKDEKLTKTDLENIKKVLKHTKNPKLYAALTKLDIPLSYIAIEAAAVTIKAAVKENCKIEIEYEGRVFVFGDKDKSDAKVVKLNLVDGHFENTNPKQSGNNCLFNSISEKVSAIGESYTADSFRNALADVMLNDPNIIREIQSNKKEYFLEIDFSGGRKTVEPAQRREDIHDEIIVAPEKYIKVPGTVTRKQFTEDLEKNGIDNNGTKFNLNHGSRDELHRDNPNRQFVTEIDHFLPLSCLAGEFEFLKGEDGLGRKLPCILIPYMLHRSLSTTCQNNKIFQQELKTCMSTGNVEQAFKILITEYQLKASEYYDFMKKNENASVFIKNQNIKFPIPKSKDEFLKQIGKRLSSCIDQYAEIKLGNGEPLLLGHQITNLKKTSHNYSAAKFGKIDKTRFTDNTTKIFQYGKKIEQVAFGTKNCKQKREDFRTHRE